MPKKKKTVKIAPAKSKAKTAKNKPPVKIARPAAPAVVTHDMIVKRAHEIWLKKNHANHTNNALQNWLEAERELRGSAAK